MAFAINTTFFSHVVSCDLIDVYQSFGETYYFHLQSKRMIRARSEWNKLIFLMVAARYLALLLLGN
jgi:hypothetical protein